MRCACEQMTLFVVIYKQFIFPFSSSPLTWYVMLLFSFVNTCGKDLRPKFFKFSVRSWWIRNNIIGVVGVLYKNWMIIYSKNVLVLLETKFIIKKLKKRTKIIWKIIQSLREIKITFSYKTWSSLFNCSCTL